MTLDAWGVAVYPIIFQFPVPQYQSYMRAAQVADRLNTNTRLQVYGPADFHVQDAMESDPNIGTDIPTAVRFTKSHPPTGLLALRIVVNSPNVTENGVQGDQDIESLLAGADVVVKVDLLSIGDHAVISTAEGQGKMDDTISEDIGTDQYPAITRITQELVDRVMKNAKLLSSKRRSDAGLVAIPVLGPTVAFALPKQRSLQVEMAKLDAIERDVILSGLMRHLDPMASNDRKRLYGSSPYGLVVTSVDGVARHAGFELNDLLLTADGERLTARYVLDRHLAIGPSRVTLKRQGELREVTLALPDK